MQYAMHGLHAGRALSYRRGHTLDTATTHVTDREIPGRLDSSTLGVRAR
jgi:hypothetical protein